jgi:alpha-glucosidase (family GH31 glycosyl hydrolase)
MRMGIRNKYSMIRYYYTKLFLGSVYGAGPFFNPMFFEFPEDPNAYIDVQFNIMLGEALKLSVNTNKLN